MTFAMKSLSLAAALGLLAIAAGCTVQQPSQSAQGPKLPDPGADGEYQVDFPEPGHGMARYIRIAIDPDLSKNCGLMRTYFAFDSATLLPQDKATLRNVAECLNQPEFEGMKLSIVGRSDSRGNKKYNVDLSRRRAESVSKLLIEAGIAENRISIASPGEAGAVGKDGPTELYSSGYDRRVDLVLAVIHKPR
jgi:outer membrane protein OmpA-like peptidoglycan-associated protein